MNMAHVSTYALGIGMVIYGLVGLMLGWQDQASAFSLVMGGFGVLGITHQNVALGRTLGAYK